jgi:ZIP family zinc transporter
LESWYGHFAIISLAIFLNGAQLFSSLYSMLPNAKSSLMRGGFSPKAAAWTLIGLFIAGVMGIQVISRILHRFIPSHVVDCDHSHDDEEELAQHDHNHHHRTPEVAERNPLPRWRSGHSVHSSYGTPSTPQLPQVDGTVGSPTRRPSFTTRVSELVRANKPLCDEDGKCYGLSAPCGQDCFKIVQARGGMRIPRVHTPLSRTATNTTAVRPALNERQPLLGPLEEEAPLLPHLSAPADPNLGGQQLDGYFPESNGYTNGSIRTKSLSQVSSAASFESHHHEDHQFDPPPEHHHHHVPTNAFLSIGLQTCIAIALHKLPEGFITYATNHANPKLGFSVFIALFIHNITEGFAMALPLYLAIKSRPKAMVWAALLGGVSQPLGAGVAALWFNLAGQHMGSEPGEGVYGGMFAVVAGIMTSVALQLFSESLDLTHNRDLCMAFAFVGMGILGVSSALTA